MISSQRTLPRRAASGSASGAASSRPRVRAAAGRFPPDGYNPNGRYVVPDGEEADGVPGRYSPPN